MITMNGGNIIEYLETTVGVKQDNMFPNDIFKNSLT